MDRGYQHNLKKKIAIRNKWTSQKLEVRAPETKQQGRKRNVVFRDTLPTLSVYFKRGFNGKAVSHTKPTTTLNFAKFLKCYLLFPTRKENHGKDVKDQHMVSPVIITFIYTAQIQLYSFQMPKSGIDVQPVTPFSFLSKK